VTHGLRRQQHGTIVLMVSSRSRIARADHEIVTMYLHVPHPVKPDSDSDVTAEVGQRFVLPSFNLDRYIWRRSVGSLQSGSSRKASQPTIEARHDRVPPSRDFKKKNWSASCGDLGSAHEHGE
jgi:hypothetical protein